MFFRFHIILFLFSVILFLSQPSDAKIKTSGANPDISLNGLFLYRAGDESSSTHHKVTNGFKVQEIELRMTSNIDAYWRGDITLAMHPHLEEGEEEEEGETHGDEAHLEYKLEPEEAFVESLGLKDWTIRVGKFKAFLGKHNRLHAHSYPFLDAPLPHQIILGEKGLNEVGISASYLTPLSWYSEIVFQALQGENEELFASENNDDMVGLLLFRNLWDINDQTTFEWNFNYVTGHGKEKTHNKLLATAFTLKWKPSDSARKTSMSWTLEALSAERPKAKVNNRRGGYSTWFKYQLNREWWLQARHEYVGIPKREEGVTRKNSLLVGYIPTEYSALRMQYDNIKLPTEEETEQRISLQLNVSMGAHPAHYY